MSAHTKAIALVRDKLGATLLYEDITSPDGRTHRVFPSFAR